MKNLEKRIWISQTHTIGQWINESIKNHSKKTAIVDGRTHITYTDLGIQVNHYSSYFLQKGIRKGNKVVIQLNNTKEYVFSILALIQIGAIPVLTNYALRDKEVTGIIERSEAIAYVYSKEILGYSYKSMAERIKKRNRELLFIISVAEIEMSSFSDVTLISSNIPKQKNQTILSQATDEIYRKTLQSSLDNEILLERIFAKLIGADAYKAGYQVDEERLQQYIEYIVDQGTGDITVEALCNTGGKFEDVAKEFRLLASKSVSERLNALYNIIERPNGELMEHQLKMLNILFRVFSQNFRCVSTYEPKPYYGNMRILCCEIQGGHFYPGFFAEDYETWKPYAKGNLTFDLIKGWHLDCITEPNLGENIKKMLDFNY